MAALTVAAMAALESRLNVRLVPLQDKLDPWSDASLDAFGFRPGERQAVPPAHAAACLASACGTERVQGHRRPHRGGIAHAGRFDAPRCLTSVLFCKQNTPNTRTPQRSVTTSVSPAQPFPATSGAGRALVAAVGWLWQPAAYHRLVVTTMRPPTTLLDGKVPRREVRTEKVRTKRERDRDRPEADRGGDGGEQRVRRGDCAAVRRRRRPRHRGRAPHGPARRPGQGNRRRAARPGRP